MSNPVASPKPLASLPVYSPHRLRQGAAHHLLVIAGLPSAEDAEFLADLKAAAATGHPLNHTLLVGQGEPLRDLVESTLGTLPTGTHLYLSGTEFDIWRLQKSARRQGMLPQEISLCASAGKARPVYCVHCGTVQEAGAEIVNCTHCGVRLQVREHFSFLQGAYIGVVADADHPYQRVAA